jgi:large subunit ribosomal protein L2
MSIVFRRPVTPSLRGQSYLVRKDLDKKEPEKSLLLPLKKTGGRNAYGRITTRHRGGGAKQMYRIVDFARSVRDVPGRVAALEYDPNRNVEIALVYYANGAKRYVLRAEGVNKGSVIVSGLDAEVSVGNSMPLEQIPVGFFVHNVELVPGAGGKIAKAAGSYVQLMGKDGGLAMLKMPSSEIRTVNLKCWATVGPVANADFRNVSWGKAGRRRHLGVRPTVRGMAMNPVDHPMGGGEGRSKSGSQPTSPWGKNSKGAITRKRYSSAIIKRRGSKK